jgi:hypothetical protein
MYSAGIEIRVAAAHFARATASFASALTSAPVRAGYGIDCLGATRAHLR